MLVVVEVALLVLGQVHGDEVPHLADVLGGLLSVGGVWGRVGRLGWPGVGGGGLWGLVDGGAVLALDALR